uniref:Uncharacterized protein n=1 Tax=Vitis vinifera TaxID=29760 RepID=F6GXG4_VITVI
MPDEIKDRTTGTRRTGNSPPGSWKIVIADEDEHSKKLVPSIEATPKGKGSKAVLWKQRWGEHPQAKRGINWFNQCLLYSIQTETEMASIARNQDVRQELLAVLEDFWNIINISIS